MTTSDQRIDWDTSISYVADGSVYIRGYELGELIGSVNFASATYLQIKGVLPTPGQVKMMDAVLCSILDYALGKPGTVAARYNVSGNPSMSAGLATAVLGAGVNTLAPEQTGQFILDTFADFLKFGNSMDVHAKNVADNMKSKKIRMPGVGHPKFKGTDPRAQKLKQIAIEQGVWGTQCQWYEALHIAYTAAIGKPDLPINDVGMISAILTEMGFSPDEMTGLAILSTIPGVIAHISEELRSGKRIRAVRDENAKFCTNKLDLSADLKTKGW